MHLSGQLSDWSIHDLLQIMQVTKKTGSLDIEGERRGRIHFRNGAVTGAELAGAKGSYSGQDRGTVADILYVLSTLDAGSFSVGSADGPETSGLSVEDVVKDLESLRHLEGEVVDAGLFEAIGIRIAHAIDSPLTIDPDDWAILASLVQPFTFGYLEAKMGRGGAVRLIHTLHRLGLAEPMDDVDDEADLLGAVAGSVSGEPTWLEQKVEEASAASGAHPAADPVAPAASVTGSVPDESADETIEVDTEDLIDPVVASERSEILRGVSAPASTTLTDGVYDEIRRLRSKVADR